MLIDSMRARSMLGALVVLTGCGGAALVDESREVGFYTCPEGSCVTAGGGESEWVGRAQAVLAEIEQDVIACNGGAPFTLRVHFDRHGEPQGLRAEPALGDAERVCVGRLVFDHVELRPHPLERVVAYLYGAQHGREHAEPGAAERRAGGRTEPAALEPAPVAVASEGEGAEPEAVAAPAVEITAIEGRAAPTDAAPLHENEERAGVPEDLIE